MEMRRWGGKGQSGEEKRRQSEKKRARKNRFNDNNPLTVPWFY